MNHKSILTSTNLCTIDQKSYENISFFSWDSEIQVKKLAVVMTVSAEKKNAS